MYMISIGCKIKKDVHCMAPAYGNAVLTQPRKTIPTIPVNGTKQ